MVGFGSVDGKKTLAFELHGLSVFWHHDYLKHQIWNQEDD